MPITVKHGGDIPPGLAALAMLAGMGQQRVPEIPRIAVGGAVGGGGGGGMREERIPWDRRLWGSEVTRRAPLTPNEALQYEAEKMQLQAKAEAEGWEQKYSAQSRQKLAAIEKARKDLRANPAFSEEEKIRADRALISQSLGIDKDVIPPDPNKEVFEPGKGPRDTWRHEETGDIMGYDRNGNQVVRIKFADTPEGRMEAHQQAVQLEQVKQQTAHEIATRKERLRLLTTMETKTDEEGNKYQVPMYKPYRVEQILQQAGFISPEAEQGPTDEQLEVELQRRVDARQRLTSQLQSYGVEVTEAEADMPEPAALAQAFLRKVKEEVQQGRELSPAILGAAQEAQALLAQYAKRGNL